MPVGCCGTQPDAVKIEARHPGTISQMNGIFRIRQKYDMQFAVSKISVFATCTYP